MVKCEVCGQDYKTAQALAAHMAFKHSQSLVAQRINERLDGDLKEALRSMQENIGFMVLRMAALEELVGKLAGWAEGTTEAVERFGGYMENRVARMERLIKEMGVK